MKLVMFDIDGTLTQTAEIDTTCFVQALQDVFGFVGINSDWSSYPHCSDSAILEVLFQRRRGCSPSPADISTFQIHFVSLLAAATAIEPFRAVDGAREFLCKLIDEPAIAVSLASGAWECSARFKLASAGLDFPRIPAAFSDDAHSREAIMQASLDRAAKFHSRVSFDSVIYVGDGVWDARACQNLNFPFIGISREPGKVASLYAEGATHVINDYLDADFLMDLLRSPTLPDSAAARPPG